VVRGAIQAVQGNDDLHLFLVGLEGAVRDELAANGWPAGAGEGGGPSAIEVVPAENVIGMSDSPVESLNKKRGSSIEVAMRLVRERRAAAFVSAGNTGACVAAASLFIGRLQAVKRPGIAVVLPTQKRPVVVIDVGANVYCKPEHLVQYGIMATVYAEEILGVKSPLVGLLNIGEEDEKGHQLAKQTHGLFQTTRLNFEGNIEGNDIFKGELGVVVCDGFVGNIVLKVSEGLSEHLLRLFQRAMQAGLAKAPEGRGVAGALKESFEEIVRQNDYSEYGGAPLLGVNGTVIIAHGRSDAKAITNAIKVARRMAAVSLNSRITEELLLLSQREPQKD
jgi:glycerol-3-phosphate acyltransferase PlsX